MSSCFACLAPCARTLAAVIALVAMATPSHAVDYFVRRTVGNDANNGLTAVTAFQTIGRALQSAQPGDVIYIGAGTYTEALVSRRNGTSTGPIRLVGDHTGARTGDKGTPTVSSSAASALTVTHSFIQVERVDFMNGARPVVWSGSSGVMTSSHIHLATDASVRVTGGSLTMNSCAIRNGSGDGLVVVGGSATIQSSTVYEVAGRAIMLDGSGATLSVLNNTIRNTGGSTIISIVRGTATIANNLIRTSNGVGVDIAQNTTAATANVWHNTFTALGNAGVRLTNGTATVRNNITTHGPSGLVYSAGSLTHSNNLYFALGQNYTGTTQGTGDRFADPLFTSASDWSLRTTSPAINAGANAASITTRDRVGTTRPIGGGYDLGAYEFTSAAAGTIPYLRDFESVATLPEWSHTNVDSAAIASFTRYLGRFVNENVILRLSTTPGAEYTLIFDFYCLDSWDGNHTSFGPDFFGVSVDGEVVLRETFANDLNDPAFAASIQDWPEAWSTNRGYGTWNDRIFRAVAVPFTASLSTTNLAFFGQNLQGINDESWGVDNVRVIAAADAQPFLANFTEVGRFGNYSATNFSTEASGIFVGDVTGDGTPDVIQGGSSITVNGVTGSILSIGTATPGVYNRVVLPALSIRQAALADFNADARLDLFTPTADASETLLLGTATGMTNAGALSFTAPSGHDATIVADFNADGLIDVASLASSGNHIGITTPTSTIPSPVFTIVSTSGIIPSDATNAGNGDFASSGDLNDDGIADFYYHYNGGRLLLSQTDRTYAHTPRIPAVSFSDANKGGSVLADYDNDGDLDLLIARRSGGVLLFRNPGSTGTFVDITAAAGLPTSGGFTSADFGDFDHDGDQDLFLVATNGQAAMYVNSGAPSYTFSLATEGVAIETRGGDCLFADADNDGDLDLFVGTQATSHASRLFRNALNDQDLAAVQRRLLVRVQGRGPGGTNIAGAGVRVELWNAANTQFLQRRDLGAARGLGGQRPLIAHFGGVSPTATYTLRVYFRHGVQTFPVVPGSASTTIGTTTIPTLFTAVEADLGPDLRVVRWREVGPED